MKAIVTDGRGVACREVPDPELSDYDSLVRMEVCLFCNTTDRRLATGAFSSGQQYPAILGHESVGVVERTGPKVRHYKPGDRVLRPYAIYPGEVRGDLHSAWGGFAEFAKVCDGQAMIDDGAPPDEAPFFFRQQQIVPADIAPEQAWLAICQKEILSSVGKFDRVEGLRFAVTGAGMVALLYGEFLKRRGAAHVTLVARRAGPLEFAKARGVADATVLTGDVDSLAPDSFDALVDSAGSLPLVDSLMTKVADGGPFYSYATYDGMHREGFFDELKARHNFIRVNPDEPSAHDEAMALLREGRIEAAPYITHRFGPERIDEAWATVTEKRTLKTAIVF